MEDTILLEEEPDTAPADVTIYDYAFLVRGAFEKSIRFLARLAEDKRDETSLGRYIEEIFRCCYMQDKILESEDGQYSCFNTGLLTPKGNAIVAIFEKSHTTFEGAKPWHLRGFKDIEDSYFADKFSDIPEAGEYSLEDADPSSVTIFKYAYFHDTSFAEHLAKLASIAEEENWGVSEGDRPFPVLWKYIEGTFRRCYVQDKILISEDGQYSCFNTGLLTKNGNDIVAMFVKSKKTGKGARPWYLHGFKEVADRFFLDKFSDIPELATYTDDYQKLYFNPNYPIIPNTDHILDDNWERIYEVIKHDKTVVRSLLVGVIEEAKKRIHRNMRLVVPQFYKDEIMYLLPINIPVGKDDEGNERYETMALAVELTATNQYRANTIFTKEMAYEKARLLMKPESNWLI